MSVTDAAHRLTLQWRDRDEPVELLAFSVQYRERVLGAVLLEPMLDPDGGARTLLEIFTKAFGFALQNALVHENAELLARLDPLTGCTNRRGGEEFLAILPGIGPDQLRRVADRVRGQIAAAISDTERGRIRVTASIGVTRLDGPAPKSADELLDQADRALYAAKAKGRNRVVLAG